VHQYKIAHTLDTENRYERRWHFTHVFCLQLIQFLMDVQGDPFKAHPATKVSVSSGDFNLTSFSFYLLG